MKIKLNSNFDILIGYNKAQNINFLIVITGFGIIIKRLPKCIQVIFSKKTSMLYFKPIDNDDNSLNFCKLYYSLVKNIIEDCTKPYVAEIELRGMGYKAQIFVDSENKQQFILTLGYSHTINYSVPQNFVIKESINKLYKTKRFLMVSLNREQLNREVHFLKSIKKKDIYKGTGLYLVSDVLKLKQGKKKK